ncbi:hypothetical protein IMZ11_10895 [Microtetraspora sp. AC03309]|uniref:hypothetical protein n=1 Tax=Microtetraspora sp. AC03309 TaxID=2779376 RepID=UPI001E2A6C1E|nr:hypothetical protein [Microtetraspora sp. AC03309]MCC5576143.1 hypothetical protein [Microtetraspora sp. AC03309]
MRNLRPRPLMAAREAIASTTSPLAGGVLGAAFVRVQPSGEPKPGSPVTDTHVKNGLTVAQLYDGAITLSDTILARGLGRL